MWLLLVPTVHSLGFYYIFFAGYPIHYLFFLATVYNVKALCIVICFDLYLQLRG